MNGVKRTAKETIELIQEIKTLMQELKDLLRGNYKFYSHELPNNLFKHPYTKIEFLEKDLQVSRLTAANYLNKLSKDDVLTKSKLGTSNYYVNHRLFDILINR
jgi:Fic family protein